MNSNPKTAVEVALSVRNRDDFERNLKLWLEGLKTISSRPELIRRTRDAPPLLRSRLIDRGHCDACLAAHVDWLCRQAEIESPHWVAQESRMASFDADDSASLTPETLAGTPEPFRERNVFLVPEAVLQLRRGRPAKSEAEKRAKNAERQRRFRRRVKAKLQRLKELETRTQE